MNGKVTYVGHLTWGYGNHIIIDNGNNITSLYGHLSQVNVKVGDEVKPGDIIGLEGQTGWATGPHVHFETRVFGIPVNPRTFISSNL
jgi:murein DD-endopeptidase MepM/ murein hydrolase activator NlpD